MQGEIPGRLKTIESHKKNGGMVAAVLPIHYPRALLRAFGILPVEVWGPPAIDGSYGAKYLQSYVCSIARNALSFLQLGGLDITDVLIVPHTCDSLQGLASILLDFVIPRQPVIPIYLPRGRRKSDIAFLADEFRAVYRRLQEITGRSPSDSDLMECTEREEEADKVLSDLCRKRRYILVKDPAFYRLVRSREYLPAEIFSEKARALLADVAEATAPGIPLILSGIVPEPMSLFDKIEEMGGLIASDDLACCGRRLYPAGTNEDPMVRMAERIIHGPPDPTRGSPIAERFQHLKKLADECRARGVIFYGVKFCEPELFDLPDLIRELQKVNIPSVAVEVDMSEPLSSQVLTRIEAFLEMIIFL